MKRSAVCLAVLLFAGAAHADDSFSLGVGVDYSSGDYGGQTDTKILSVPLSAKYATGDWSFKASLPWMRVEGDANVVPGLGAISNTNPRVRGRGNGNASAPASGTTSGIGDLRLSATYAVPMQGNWGVGLTGTVLKADGYGAQQYFPDETQLTWLEAQLAANDRPWLFAFFHIAPFTSRDEGILELGLRLRLMPLFEQYGVDAVFTGHNHGYERLLVNGITYLTIAGGGAPFYEHGAPEPGSQVAQPAHHYLLVEVSGDQLSAQAIDPGGEIIDRFILTSSK